MADLTKSRMHIDHLDEDSTARENPEESLSRLGAATDTDLVSESPPKGRGRLLQKSRKA